MFVEFGLRAGILRIADRNSGGIELIVTSATCCLCFSNRFLAGGNFRAILNRAFLKLYHEMVLFILIS